MANSTERTWARLGAGDLVAALRILVTPVAVVALLLAASRLFHTAPQPESTAGSWLGSVPREAWACALLAYLAAIAPRQGPHQPGLSPLARGLILAVAGLCFWLELDLHDTIAPLMRTSLACALAAACVVAATAVARAERLRRRQMAEQHDRMLEQMILDLEKHGAQAGFDPAVTHPALFAEVGSVLKTGSSSGTSIWFLRPHPALGHRRPIDVLREPDGEARLLHASRRGPNS